MHINDPAVRLLTKQERRSAYETVFRASFPRAELRPLGAIERLVRSGEYYFYGMEHDGALSAFFTFWKRGDYVLLDYLCVEPEKRSAGLGAKLFTAVLAAMPPEKVCFGEAEAPVTGNAARDRLIRRRLAFYARLGARTVDYDTATFGVHYKTLAWSARAVDPAALAAEHREFYRLSLPKAVYDAAVQIPLRAGEAVYPLRDWVRTPEDKEEEQ